MTERCVKPKEVWTLAAFTPLYHFIEIIMILQNISKPHENHCSLHLWADFIQDSEMCVWESVINERK